jgi:hypothetical protein
MASPVAHALAGWSLLLLARPRSIGLRELAIAAFLTVLADFDLIAVFVVGHEGHYWHHTVTHTAAWSALAGLVLAAVSRLRRGRADWPQALLVALLVGSHCVVDYYTIDRSFPHGIPVWWPLSVEFYVAAEPVFWNIQRGSLRDLVGWHNQRAMLSEAAILLPVVAVCYGVYRWSGGERGRTQRDEQAESKGPAPD